jgi:hypothetical protein
LLTDNQRDVVAAPLAEWISLGVLAGSVPRDVIDEAVAACGRAPKRAGGKRVCTLTGVIDDHGRDIK